MLYMICSDCGIPFNPHAANHKKFGYFSQCGSCGRKEDKKHGSRHMGIQGGEGLNKAGNIAIVRHPSKHMAKFIRNIAKAPFNANLPLGSPSSPFNSEE